MKYDNLDVLVLTYNRADYLRIQLDSIFQSSADWRETIIIDNASTDHTAEVLEEVAKRYPSRKMRIVRHEKNIGNANNFIFSQSVAENEYVAVFHDDDAIHPEYIDRAMYLLTKNKDAVICSGGADALYNVNNENWPMLPDEYLLYPAGGGAFAQLLIGRMMFMNCIYKTTVYKSVQYRPDLYGKLHDIIFLMEICQHGDGIYQQGTTARWRQHIQSDSNTLSTGPYPNEILNICTYLNKMEKEEKHIFKDIQIYDEIKSPVLYNFAYFLYQWSYLQRFLPWDAFRGQMRKKKIFSKDQYITYDKFMDDLYNPLILREASNFREKCRHQYYYRMGGM